MGGNALDEAVTLSTARDGRYLCQVTECLQLLRRLQARRVVSVAAIASTRNRMWACSIAA
jgi:hypothetical protein